MKKIYSAAFLLCSCAVLCAGQKSGAPAKPKPTAAKTAAKITPAKTAPAPPVKPKTSAIKTISEISAADWKILTDALTAEDWNGAASVSARYIERLKTDNAGKQLARLRYFYLYALAGKILKSAAANSAETTALRNQLKESAAAFAGEEFVLPPRAFRADCRDVLNYVCPVAGDEKAFRTTATVKNGTDILSFDYVLFARKIDVAEFADNKTFLGGVLRRAEFNEDATKPWVMRLIFNRGFVRVALQD